MAGVVRTNTVVIIAEWLELIRHGYVVDSEWDGLFGGLDKGLMVGLRAVHDEVRIFEGRAATLECLGWKVRTVWMGGMCRVGILHSVQDDGEEQTTSNANANAKVTATATANTGVSPLRNER